MFLLVEKENRQAFYRRALFFIFLFGPGCLGGIGGGGGLLSSGLRTWGRRRTPRFGLWHCRRLLEAGPASGTLDGVIFSRQLIGGTAVACFFGSKDCRCFALAANDANVTGSFGC